MKHVVYILNIRTYLKCIEHDGNFMEHVGNFLEQVGNFLEHDGNIMEHVEIFLYPVGNFIEHMETCWNVFLFLRTQCKLYGTPLKIYEYVNRNSFKYSF